MNVDSEISGGIIDQVAFFAVDISVDIDILWIALILFCG